MITSIDGSILKLEYSLSHFSVYFIFTSVNFILANLYSCDFTHMKSGIFYVLALYCTKWYNSHILDATQHTSWCCCFERNPIYVCYLIWRLLLGFHHIYLKTVISLTSRMLYKLPLIKQTMGHFLKLILDYYFIFTPR